MGKLASCQNTLMLDFQILFFQQVHAAGAGIARPPNGIWWIWG